MSAKQITDRSHFIDRQKEIIKKQLKANLQLAMNQSMQFVQDGSYSIAPDASGVMASAEKHLSLDINKNLQADMVIGVSIGSSIRLLIGEIGIPSSIAQTMGEHLGFTQAQTSKLVGVSEKTFRNHIKNDKDLKGLEADLFASIYELIQQGQLTFKDEDKFRQWLNTKSESLNFKRPIDYLETVTGVNFLIDQLKKIRNGIFA